MNIRIRQEKVADHKAVFNLIEKAFAAGFDSHLVKPIDPDQLSELLQLPPRSIDE